MTCSAKWAFLPSRAVTKIGTWSSKIKSTVCLDPMPHGPSQDLMTTSKGNPLKPPLAFACSMANLAACWIARSFLSRMRKPILIVSLEDWENENVEIEIIDATANKKIIADRGRSLIKPALQASKTGMTEFFRLGIPFKTKTILQVQNYPAFSSLPLEPIPSILP